MRSATGSTPPQEHRLFRRHGPGGKCRRACNGFDLLSTKSISVYQPFLTARRRPRLDAVHETFTPRPQTRRHRHTRSRKSLVTTICFHERRNAGGPDRRVEEGTVARHRSPRSRRRQPDVSSAIPPRHHSSTHPTSIVILLALTQEGSEVSRAIKLSSRAGADLFFRSPLLGAVGPQFEGSAFPFPPTIPSRASRAFGVASVAAASLFRRAHLLLTFALRGCPCPSHSAALGEFTAAMPRMLYHSRSRNGI